MQATGLETSVWLTWTPWLIISGLIFLVIWLRNAAIVITGGESLDRRLAGLRGDVFIAYREGLANGLRAFGRWVGEPERESPLAFSALSFWVCAGAAVIYPGVFLTINWASGGSGAFAGMTILPDAATPEARWLVLLALALILIGPGTLSWGLKEFWRASVTVTVAFAFAFAFAFLFASALPGAFPGAFAFAGALAGTLPAAFAGAFMVAFSVLAGVGATGAGAGAGNLIFSFAGVVAFLIAGPFLADSQDRQGKGWRIVPLFAVVLVLSVAGVAIASGWGWIRDITQVAPKQSPDAPDVIPLTLIFFLMLLPALNAPLDWLSLGTSRLIMGWVARAPEAGTNLLGVPVIGWFLHFGIILFDLLLAALFAAAIVFTTVAGVALFSQTHIWAGGAPLYDVPAIIAQIRANPADPAFTWIYAMMFWTLVPTLVHSTAWAGLTVTGIVKGIGIAPGLAGLAQSAHDDRAIGKGALAVTLLSFLQLLPGLFLIYLLGVEFGPDILAWIGAYCGVDNPIAFFGNLLLDWSEAIARAIQG